MAEFYDDAEACGGFREDELFGEGHSAEQARLEKDLEPNCEVSCA